MPVIGRLSVAGTSTTAYIRCAARARTSDPTITKPPLPIIRKATLSLMSADPSISDLEQFDEVDLAFGRVVVPVPNLNKVPTDQKPRELD